VVKPLVAQAETGEATALHLISAPELIFDEDGVSDALTAAFEGVTDSSEVRAAAVRILGDAQKAGRAEIARAFAATPFDARAMTSAYCFLTDQLVRSTLQIAVQRLHPKPNPTSGERLAVIGVGGYGRGEMAPFSDVDLLFLIPYKATAWTESVIESMLYMLWDLKLKVGHSTRTIRDCIRLGSEDFTIQTALLEHRFIAGNLELAAELDETLKTDLFSGSGRNFIEAKLEERA
jgi:[protein-PII] uridylyltransferase